MELLGTKMPDNAKDQKSSIILLEPLVMTWWHVNVAVGNKSFGLAYIHPLDFIYLTVYNLEIYNDIEKETLPLESYNGFVYQGKINVHPYLKLNYSEKENEYQLKGHEGRHRAMAIYKAGYIQMPIFLTLPYRIDQNDKFESNITLVNQWGNNFKTTIKKPFKIFYN